MGVDGMMKRDLILAVIGSMAVLSACGSDNEEVTDTVVNETLPVETVIVTELSETLPYESDAADKADVTASSEDISRIITENEMPVISISEDMSFDDIMLAGENAGEYYKVAAQEFFGFGIERDWKINDDRVQLDGIAGIAPYLVNSGYRKAFGYYTDRENDIYAPMDYEQARQFIIDRIGLTENGFDGLCQSCPSNYLGIDGTLYINSGDGGGAGWSFSRITGYEFDDDRIIFYCERVGSAEDRGYEEDVIAPFTFTLANDNGVWKLDGCTYGEGLFDLFTATE